MEAVIQCMHCYSDKIVPEEKVKQSILDIVDYCPICKLDSTFMLNIPATLSLNYGAESER